MKQNFVCLSNMWCSSQAYLFFLFSECLIRTVWFNSKAFIWQAWLYCTLATYFYHVPVSLSLLYCRWTSRTFQTSDIVKLCEWYRVVSYCRYDLCLSSLSLSFSFSRATSNNKVREQVVMELSYVNSDLQLLMEQLEGLNSSVEVYQNVQ